ncbi:unnamed protein product [Urochloa humidicola]
MGRSPLPSDGHLQAVADPSNGSTSAAPSIAINATAATTAGRLQPRIHDLFCKPVSPIIQEKPLRVQRHKRTFDMTAVRRSAHLANKHGLALHRAQKNLLCKLGLQGDDATSIEAVLQDYIKSTQGPLPDYIIAAMTALLDLDDGDAEQMVDALTQHTGDGINDLQLEQDGLLEQGG